MVGEENKRRPMGMVIFLASAALCDYGDPSFLHRFGKAARMYADKRDRQ